MNRPGFLPTFLSLALLAGCASTGGLAPMERPLQADALAATRTFAGAGDATFPRIDWWRAFGDPQLDALVEEGLSGSPSLAIADARARQAQAQAGLADAARQPTLGATAQYSGIRIPETIVPAPLGGDYKGVVLLGLQLKYAPDLWGGDAARWQAALGEARASQVEAQAARVSLASNIVHSYLALAQAEAARAAATAEGARADHLLSLGRERVRAGLDNRMQLKLAESTSASARQQAQAAGQQADAARNALAALLGKGPDRGLSIHAPTLLDAPEPAIPAVLPNELLGHRADVVAARWRVEAARQGIRASKAAFYPTVNLAALAGVASGHLSDLFTSQALVAQGGPALSLPIFDGGRLRAQLAKHDADYDLAVAAYNQALVSGLREVADALQAARALDRQLAAAREARDAAAAAWDLATQRYRAGLGTQLDVLSAQRPLLQLDLQIATLRAQRLAATADLDRALGGGLSLQSPSIREADLAKIPTP